MTPQIPQVSQKSPKSALIQQSGKNVKKKTENERQPRFQKSRNSEALKNQDQAKLEIELEEIGGIK